MGPALPAVQSQGPVEGVGAGDAGACELIVGVTKLLVSLTRQHSCEAMCVSLTLLVGALATGRRGPSSRQTRSTSPHTLHTSPHPSCRITLKTLSHSFHTSPHPLHLPTPCQVGGYQAHWQLLPPRTPLPPSLAPASSLLLHPDLLRLVWFILRSCAPASTSTPAPTPAAPGGVVAAVEGQPEQQQLRSAAVPGALGPGNQGSDQGFDQGSGAGFPEVSFSEDVLLSALNLLSLQLHQLLAASSQAPGDRLEPGVTAHAVAALTGRQAGQYSYQPLGISAALASLLAPPVAVSEEVADCCRCAQGRRFLWGAGAGVGARGARRRSCQRERAAFC